MVTHSGKPLDRPVACTEVEKGVEFVRLRRELLQRIRAREIRRQAMRRAPR